MQSEVTDETADESGTGQRWNCYQEEDEPQKLHNFLISSLPDT